MGWSLTTIADTCSSGSTCVFGSSSGQENSLTKEEARQNKEQWDGERHIRKKVNTLTERNLDKLGDALTQQESCNNSLNINAYWEPNTQRCLDRQTGRPLNL